MEYVVVSIVVIAVLFMPAGPDGRSLVDLVLEALRSFQAHSTYLLSMP